MAVFSFIEPFRHRNYPFYFTGQVISLAGSWFQNLAIALVVLEQTGSAQSLSFVTVAQFTPIILFSVVAGRVADRFRPKLIMLVTSLSAAVIVGGIAVVLATEAPIWIVIILLFLLGTSGAFERVAAQTIIFELVGDRDLSRAVALTTIAQGIARSVGPGLAGIAFQSLGPVWCMTINAASFLAVALSMLLIRSRELHSRGPASGESAVPKVALLRSHSVRTVLIANVVIALFGFSLMITITTTVSIDFAADAGAVGLAHGLNAVGAIVGGMIGAARANPRVVAVVGATALLGAVFVLNAVAPNLTVFLILAPILGVGISYYQATIGAVAQRMVPPDQIGRMMSLMTLGHFGVTPFAAILAGFVVDLSSGRAALAMGGCAAFAVAVFISLRIRNFRAGQRPLAEPS